MCNTVICETGAQVAEYYCLGKNVYFLISFILYMSTKSQKFSEVIYRVGLPHSCSAEAAEEIIAVNCCRNLCTKL